MTYSVDFFQWPNNIHHRGKRKKLSRRGRVKEPRPFSVCCFSTGMDGWMDGWMDVGNRFLVCYLYAQSVFTNSNHRQKLRIQEKRGQSLLLLFLLLWSHGKETKVMKNNKAIIQITHAHYADTQCHIKSWDKSSTCWSRFSFDTLRVIAATL